MAKALFAVMAQRALGFAGGAARVVERRDIVGTGESRAVAVPAARRQRADRRRNRPGQA